MGAGGLSGGVPCAKWLAVAYGYLFTDNVIKLLASYVVRIRNGGKNPDSDGIVRCVSSLEEIMRRICVGLTGWAAFVDVLNRYTMAIASALFTSVAIGVCLAVAVAYLLLGLFVATLYGYALLIPATITLGALVYCAVEYDSFDPEGVIVRYTNLLLSAAVTVTGGCYLWALAGSGYGSLAFGLGSFCTASVIALRMIPENLVELDPEVSGSEAIP